MPAIKPRILDGSRSPRMGAFVKGRAYSSDGRRLGLKVNYHSQYGTGIMN